MREGKNWSEQEKQEDLRYREGSARRNDKRKQEDSAEKLLEAVGELPEELIGEAADPSHLREELQEEITALGARAWRKWIPLGTAGVLAAALLCIIVGHYMAGSPLVGREPDSHFDSTSSYSAQNHTAEKEGVLTGLVESGEAEEQFGLHFYVTADAEILQARVTPGKESVQKQSGKDVFAPDGETEGGYVDHYTPEDTDEESNLTGSAGGGGQGKESSAGKGETVSLGEAVTKIEISDAFPLQSTLAETGGEKDFSFTLTPGEAEEEKDYRFSMSKGITTAKEQKSCPSGEAVSFTIPFEQKLSEKEKILLEGLSSGACSEWDMKWMGKIQFYRGNEASMTTVYLGRQGEQLYAIFTKIG